MFIFLDVILSQSILNIQPRSLIHTYDHPSSSILEITSNIFSPRIGFLYLKKNFKITLLIFTTLGTFVWLKLYCFLKHGSILTLYMMEEVLADNLKSCFYNKVHLLLSISKIIVVFDLCGYLFYLLCDTRFTGC